VPRGAKALGLRLMEAAGRAGGRPDEFLRRGAAGQPIFWGGAEAFTEVEKRRLLGPAIQQRLGGLDSWEAIRPYWERFRQLAWEPAPLQWMTYLDLNLRLPELLLMRVDKMTMGVSLEGRVPFLDHKLVELVMGIPERMKVRNGRLKHLLKEGVRDLLPAEIVNRRKQGFGVPMSEWFTQTIRGFARTELLEFCDETGYLDPAEVLRLTEQDRGPQTWYLLNLALWWKEYIAARDPVRDRQAVGVH
jgi:asparagine synthase (glutamine-hydrolysing)